MAGERPADRHTSPTLERSSRYKILKNIQCERRRDFAALDCRRVRKATLVYEQIDSNESVSRDYGSNSNETNEESLTAAANIVTNIFTHIVTSFTLKMTGTCCTV